MQTRDRIISQYQETVLEYEQKNGLLVRLKQKSSNLMNEVLSLRNTGRFIQKRISDAEKGVTNYSNRITQAEKNREMARTGSSVTGDLTNYNVYEEELRKIKKEEADTIERKKEERLKAAEREKKEIKSRIEFLKSGDKNETFVIPSDLNSEVIKITNKRKAWDEFFDKADSSDKRVKQLLNQIKQPGEEEIKNLANDIPDTAELLSICGSVTMVRSQEEIRYDNKNLNKYIIPGIIAAVISILLFILLYTFKASGAEVAGEAVAWIIWSAILSVGLGAMGAYCVSDDIDGTCMSFFIPVAMLIILIYNNWGLHLGVTAWVNNVFWLVCLAGILWLLNKIDDEDVALVFFFIFSVLAFLWLIFKIHIKTPGFLVSFFSFVAGATIKFLFPIAVGVGLFFLMKYLFTETRVGKITVISECKKNISSMVDSVEQSVKSFKILYNYEEIGKYVQRKEDIEESEWDFRLVDDTAEADIESARKSIHCKYKEKVNDLDRRRNEQKKERDSYFDKMDKDILRLKSQKSEADRKLKNAKEEWEKNQYTIRIKEEELNSSQKEFGRIEQMILSLKDILVQMSSNIRGACRDPLTETAGVLCDTLYFDIASQDREGLPTFKAIKHNAEKLVCIYEENEIENNNLSEGLANYIEWFISAFTRVNSWEVIEGIKFRIVDVVSGGKDFIGGQKGKVFEVFGDLQSINRFEYEMKEQIDSIIEPCSLYGLTKVDIADLNKYLLEESIKDGVEFGVDEVNLKYIIAFILIPDISVQNTAIIPPSLWTLFNGCQRYGIMPIFFVGKNTWESIEDNTPIKMQVKKENVYFISGAKKNRIDITKY